MNNTNKSNKKTSTSSEDRVLMLSNINGVECVEVVNFGVGDKYELLYPIEIKKQGGEKTMDIITEVNFNKVPKRKDSKIWATIEDGIERTDKMTVDLTDLKDVHIDELSALDADNLDLLLSSFLPERFSRIATESLAN